MQTFSAANYLGRRLRFSGGLKAVDVEGWAGLWMRVDGPRGSEPLAFDNMENRPLKGSRDWQRHEIVPAHARAIALVVRLVGRGEVLVADFGLESMSDDVPTTGLYERYPDEPLNLDFSETAEAGGG
jgi:hypothetical protein